MYSWHIHRGVAAYVQPINMQSVHCIDSQRENTAELVEMANRSSRPVVPACQVADVYVIGGEVERTYVPRIFN
jgi:hypothetical protein